jgi:hypothetical protein
VLILCALPLAAQTSFSMNNAWTQTVTGQAQNVTSKGPQLSQQINANGTWSTGLPANANTLLNIAFLQGSTYLVNTPVQVSNVLVAKIFANAQNQLLLSLTPVNTRQMQHSIDEANVFLSQKLPTKEFCLQVTTLKGGLIQLANGLVIEATGKTSLLPKEGKSGCVCGRGLPALPGHNTFRFDVMSACDKTKK